MPLNADSTTSTTGGVLSSASGLNSSTPIRVSIWIPLQPVSGLDVESKRAHSSMSGRSPVCRQRFSPQVVGGQPRADADGGLHAQPSRSLQQRAQLRVLLQDDDAVDAQLTGVQHL